MSDILEVTGLQHAFAAHPVLTDISLHVASQEVVAIMGPNGAGKTTLLRLLAGILPVQQGVLRCAGLPVHDDAARSRMRGHIGLLTEAPGLYEHLSVRENLTLHGRLQRIPEAALAARIQGECAQLRILDRLEQRCGTLSKGLKQRVALARALLHQPRLLLLDEPTSGLDPESSAELHAWIRTMVANGRSVILATHDFAEAQRLSDRRLVLNRRLCAWPEASPTLVLRVPGAHHTRALAVLTALRGTDTGVQVEGDMLRVSAADSLAAPALVRALVEAGVDLLELRPCADDPLHLYRKALTQLASPA